MCSDWSPKKKLFLDRVRPSSHGNKTKTDPPGLSSCSQTNGTEFNMANCGEDWTNGRDGVRSAMVPAGLAWRYRQGEPGERPAHSRTMTKSQPQAAAAEHANESGQDDKDHHQPAGPATCSSPAMALDARIFDSMWRILCTS